LLCSNLKNNKFENTKSEKRKQKSKIQNMRAFGRVRKQYVFEKYLHEVKKTDD